MMEILPLSDAIRILRNAVTALAFVVALALSSPIAGANGTPPIPIAHATETCGWSGYWTWDGAKWYWTWVWTCVPDDEIFSNGFEPPPPFPPPLN